MHNCIGYYNYRFFFIFCKYSRNKYPQGLWCTFILNFIYSCRSLQIFIIFEIQVSSLRELDSGLSSSFPFDAVGCDLFEFDSYVQLRLIMVLLCKLVRYIGVLDDVLTQRTFGHASVVHVGRLFLRSNHVFHSHVCHFRRGMET